MEGCGNESSYKNITCTGVCKGQNFRDCSYNRVNPVCGYYSDSAYFRTGCFSKLKNCITDEPHQFAASRIYA